MSELRILDAANPAQFNAWNHALEALPPSRRDMHWLPRYVAAYASLIPGAQALAACWTSDDALILQPFIRTGASLTSPYGFGGPVSNKLEGPRGRHRQYYDDLAEWMIPAGIEREWCRLHPFLFEHQRQVLERAAPVRIDVEKAVAWIDLTGDLDGGVGRTHGHKAAIKRAEREGVTVSPTNEQEGLAWFHEVYIETMRRREANERWFFPLAFLDRLTSATSAAWTAMIAHRRDGTPEAGALILGAFDTAYYHYAGRKLIAPDVGAGHLLVKRCAQWAKDQGYKRLHLGGATSTDRRDPLLRFKVGFTHDMAWTYVYSRSLA